MSNALAYAAMLVVAILASAVLGALAVARDVSYYAWLFVLPAIPVGLLVAMGMYHLGRWPKELLARRAGFVFVASIVTMLVAGIAVQVFVQGGRAPKPEFVYIRGQDTYEMSAPETPAVDETIVVTVRRKDGPWQQIRLKDHRHSHGSYTETPPPLTSGPPAGSVALRTDPWGAVVVSTSNSDTGEMKVLVSSAEPFTMWIEIGARTPPLKSNVVTVTPRKN